ncbi:MAG: cation:proton antiporter [Bacteroidetes bacterium]|nr:MAG: cation:proton antiporter [Bacteroidota bacterium]
MLVLLAVLIGVLYGSAVYLLLRRNIFKLILGLIFLGHATNLLLFVASGLTSGKPAFLRGLEDETIGMSDPLPQALILTAIVIGLGVTAFALTLVYRFYKVTKTVDFDELSENE